MIISCPSCKTRYLVDPSALGERGRSVRCAKCSQIWSEKPPADMPKRVDILPPESESGSLPPGSNLPVLVQRQRKGASVGWLGVLLLIVIVILGGVLAREQIVTVWSPASKLYSFLGLSITKNTLLGLQISEIEYEKILEDGIEILIVTGKISNSSDAYQIIPGIKIVLEDDVGIVLMEWIFAVKIRGLEGGHSTQFKTLLRAPPSEAANLNCGFVDDLTL